MPRQSFRLARSLGKPVYSSAYPFFTDDWQFEVHVPVSREGRVVGVMVGVYRIREILGDSVPWWLAERYRISIVGNSGKVLGTRSKIESAVTDEGYQVAFDPPGWGLTIHAVPYHAPRPLASVLLSVSLVILALIVLWNAGAQPRRGNHLRQPGLLPHGWLVGCGAYRPPSANALLGR